MPRAFLITHRRYNGPEEFEENIRGFSPERGVRIPEYNSNQPTSDGVSDCASETSSECPEELYNLTKLAEVSLAAAAGTLIHPNNVIHHRSASPHWTGDMKDLDNYRDVSKETASLRQGIHIGEASDLSLRERTRLFFERIESERELLEARSRRTCLRSPQLSEESRQRLLNNQPQNPPVRRISSVQSDSSKTDDAEEHECPDCGKKYSTSSNLARHRQTHRSLADKKARRCPHCDKVYVSMPAYSMHVRTHNQGCKCHYCGKCFSRPWLLQGHIRTHTGEKPFKCTICNKAFADKSNLRAHVQTHSNTKPHVCGRCGKAFALKSYLYKHEESSCMRSHQRSISETKEEVKIVTAAVPTSSPISVIVPRPAVIETSSSPVIFSNIIRHTKTSQPITIPSPQPKRQYREIQEDKQSDLMTRMVIRTSVISSNPEHVPGRLPVGKSSALDFSDPTRASAFTRPMGISLNLAIA